MLADVGMPERDGYEVAAFVKGTPELAHIPVLLLTGAFEPIDEARAQAAGCDGVLVKPFEPQMVISRVKELIAGRRPAEVPPASSLPPVEPTPAAGRVATAPAGRRVRSTNTSTGWTRPSRARGAAAARVDRRGSQAAPPARRERRPSGVDDARQLASARRSWPPGEPDASEAAARAECAAQRPAAVPSPSRRAVAAPAPPVPTPVQRPLPTLAEAFAALLAAEQRQPSRRAGDCSPPRERRSSSSR